jgi:predicted nucleotidyltransferase
MQNTKVMLDFPFPGERVFRYQAMQDILHHLVTNPLEEFTQQELASITESDISSISRSVDLLKELGVITVSMDRPARISIDTDHLQQPDPIFMIPQAEFRKPIQAYLNEVSERIQESTEIDTLVGVILFGSVTRGAADRQSDIDILIIVDGDLTHGRRISTSLARDIEEKPFDGNRYEFEVLVETPDTAVSHGDDLKEIFDTGLILEQSDQLQEVRQDIYDTSGEVAGNAD